MAKLTEGTPVTALITPGMDDQNPWATGDARWLRGGLHFVPDMKALNAMPIERRYGSVVLVDHNADGEKQALKWTGTKTDGTDGKWEDTELGTQDPANAPAGISFSEFNNPMFGGADITKVIVEEPLEVYEDPDIDGGIRMRLKHGYFEKLKAPGYLAYLSTPVEVLGSQNAHEQYHRGQIWSDYTVVPSGAFIEVNRVGKSIGLQEADELDPNVTGGTDYFIASFQTIDGVAPDNGFIESLVINTQTKQIATDKDGRLLAVRRNYQQGQPLAPKHDPLIAMGVVNAKGMTEYGQVLVHNFKDDVIRVLNYTDGPSGIVAQALTSESATGDAMQQFEIDTGYQIRPVVRHFDKAIWDMAFALQHNIPKTQVKAGAGQISVQGIDLHNLTPINVEVTKQNITVSATSAVADFYLGGHIKRDTCMALGGKEVTLNVGITDKDSGWHVAAYSRADGADENFVYNSRSNSIINIEEGWTLVKEMFVSEDVVSGEHLEQMKFTMPEDITSLTFIVYPVEESNPETLILSTLRLDVDPFNGYEEQSLKLVGLQHMHHMLAKYTLTQGTQTFGNIRYTINDKPDGLPMPWGVADRDIQGMYLDPSKNVISGSVAAHGEGALVADTDLRVTVGVKLRIWNEQSRTTTDTWWIVKEDVDGIQSIVPNSTNVFQIPPNKGTEEFYMKDVTIALEPGESIMLRTSDSQQDGAFIESISKAKPALVTTLQIGSIV